VPLAGKAMVIKSFCIYQIPLISFVDVSVSSAAEAGITAISGVAMATVNIARKLVVSSFFVFFMVFH
jgi:hypothetical protein